MFYAHSTKEKSNKIDWQLLRNHLVQVAGFAAEMAKPFGLSRAAYVSGLFHDLGKYQPEFQRRLEGAKEQVDHSTAGAIFLHGLAKGADKSIAELIAYGIAGHHAGLPDKLSEARSSLDNRMTSFEGVIDPVWQEELQPDVSDLVPKDFHPSKTNAAFQFAFLGRMIFSCLVDADFKDTEAFYNRIENRKSDRDWPRLQSLLPGFQIAFESHMQRFSKSETDVSRLRGKILTHVRSKATETPGLFTLTVPTGGGKTLTSLAFALDHAKIHGHTRIIYAIPFTSIIDQTAAIFYEALGRDHVLEHHSTFDVDKNDDKKEWVGKEKLKLAMEDWAAPVVLTTNVQLYESLFAAKPSRARKLHNIANSIIILDEAQTIPPALLSPISRAIEELCEHYGCTIILCTATQPALDKANFDEGHPAGLPLQGRELAPDPHALANELKRVTLRIVGEMSNEQLVAALAQNRQALVIVNSRKHALELYREAQSAGLPGLIHLSTRQYAADRRGILKDVRHRLKEKMECRVIATSLIEAGVDIDFPKVWRAEAGLDQIAQAAGRCNREGRRSIEESIVSVFAASDYPPPQEIRGLVGDFKRMADKHEKDLLSPTALTDYFGEVYWRKGRKGLDAKNILDLFKISIAGTDFSYRTAAEKFQMIESGMVPVIVARDEKSKEAVRLLSIEGVSSGRIARELQAYVVQVLPRARDLLIANGHVVFESPKLRGDQFAVLQDKSELYESDVGLVWENADYISAEALVI